MHKIRLVIHIKLCLNIKFMDYYNSCKKRDPRGSLSNYSRRGPLILDIQYQDQMDRRI